jgi:DNA-binding response OmpR family regulator
MPIIALSANVMADVLDKCIDAGFSNYITKPVDFKALSTVMGDLLDPDKEKGLIVGNDKIIPISPVLGGRYSEAL